MKQWAVAQTLPHLGLGNRVRSVLGVRSLAFAEGREFAYSWPVGRAFGARFDELWRVEDRTVPYTPLRVLGQLGRYRDGRLGWLDDHARRDPLWIVRTAHELPDPAWRDTFRALRPVPQVSDRVQMEFSGHLAGRPYVGVMIRAHAVSHEQTQQHSPLSWYVAQMRAIREADPDLDFFVSCDVPKVQRQVQEQFDRCYALTDKGGYNSPEALRAAVTDLYLLAGAQHLLGPHFSSFPELAQYLAGNHLRLQTSLSGPSFDPAAARRLVSDPLHPAQRSG